MKKIITSIGLSLSLLAGYNGMAYNGNAPHGAKQPVFRLDPSFKDGVNYTGGHIIFKVKEQYRNNCFASYINETKLTPILNYLGVNSLVKLFPMEKAPKVKYNKLGQAYADLSLTYEIKFSNKDISLEKAINLMLSTGLFEYADPRYIRKTSVFFPNDPKANSSSATQYQYLNRIKAYSAWDPTIGGTQGDTNVVIGIVDSGTDLLHIDLKPNFKHNYADPINGVDDDNDGYIDNFTGWDVAGGDYNNVVGDNKPQIMGVNNEHGSHVSGDASAATNNGIGVAGVGFNCKLLPVKCAADNDTRGTGGEGYIITGYEGIQYAASHGAKVINCSWGGTGGSSYEQSVITAATINYNCIVVAAAGNDGADEISYPGGYNYVLSVAATNANNDAKASFSNWNYTVDLSAPGNGIYNTIYSATTSSVSPGSYASLSGTSMASPITAGGVALVLSKFPSYTGMQAGQRLIVTTDNNYASNITSLANKLGSGRLNLYTAVSSTVAAQSESVIFTNDSINDHNDLVFTQGDTLFIGGSFINYLNATSSAATASITAVSGGGYLTGITSSYALGAMNSNTSKSNVTTPFKFKVGNAPLNTTVVFQVKITDGAYSQSYFFSVLLNPDYVNITINQVFTTITSRGKIGWSKDGEAGGLGFSYNGDNLLYEGGLMIGTSATAVSDCVRGTSSTGATDTDFVTAVTAHKITPSMVSEFDVTGAFNDANASPVQKLLVHHNAYAWSTPGSSKFVIVEYIIHNTGSSTLSNLYAGIFADWDVDAATAATNKSDYDASRKLGYTWATPSTSNLYAGMQLLTNTPPNFYAIDNIGAGAGGVNISTSAGFKKADKYTTLSTMRTTAGDSTATGNDVCNVMSSGPFNIAAGDSIKVAFALLAGDNLTDLQTSADTAIVRYTGQPLGIKNDGVMQNFAVYPNPAVNQVNFTFNAAEAQFCTISLINMLGETVKVSSLHVSANATNAVSFDVSNLAPGAYMYKVTGASGKSNNGKVLITH